jgi:hypothetical protein
LEEEKSFSWFLKMDEDEVMKKMERWRQKDWRVE